MFSCNMPPALLAEWPGISACYCNNIGWNGYRNKSQLRKLILEKKTLPPLVQGLEPATFQSWVQCSNHLTYTPIASECWPVCPLGICRVRMQSIQLWLSVCGMWPTLGTARDLFWHRGLKTWEGAASGWVCTHVWMKCIYHSLPWCAI